MNTFPDSAQGAEDVRQKSRSGLAAAANLAYSHHFTIPGLDVLCLRLPDEGLILVTPAEKSFEHITPADIFLVSLAGDILDAPENLKLPPELTCYLKVFQDRPDVDALAHLHPFYACRYALQGQLFQLPDRQSRQQIKELLRVLCRQCPSRFTGLCSCRTDIRQSYAGANALLLKEDGVITLAADLKAALRMTEVLENAARDCFLTDPPEALQ